MMNTVKLLLLLSLFVSSGIKAQDRKIQRAEKKFDDYAFMDAISSYEELIKQGYSEQEIYESLGNANYLNANYEEAANWYGKLVDLKGADIDKEYLYRYAQVLKSTGDYKKSDVIMERFKAAKLNDNRASLFVGKKDYLKEIEKNSGRYDISNLQINSSVSDFSPSYYKEMIVFSTARDTGLTSRKIHQWNNGAFLNLYVAEADQEGSLSNAQKFSSKLNSKTHESSAVFTSDGKTVYFTRNNADNNRFKRDEKGISRLKVLRAELVEDQWTNVTELPFNAANYSVAHPALSADEKTLYFSSDMPGTLGASDIFSVAINEDGSYGEPKNLGNKINTESRETFPFVFESTLFFASDGHPGLGGLDIFATKLDGSSSEILNIGKPINGQQDDFSFITDASGKGYFASNRDGGAGEDDIYSFQENQPLQFECLAQLKGTVIDEETKQVISEAQVSIVDASGQIVTTVVSDENGAFNLDIDCTQNDLILVANKKAYDSKSTAFNMIIGQINKVDVMLPKAPEQLVPAIGSDLIAALGLKPILFDLDSSEIRQDASLILDKAGDFLKKNKSLKIEVKSHTDAKASRRYNQRLSQLRAKATFDYLVALGVDANTISFKGYGENELLNNCVDWEQCSKDENEKNRRSELIIRELP